MPLPSPPAMAPLPPNGDMHAELATFAAEMISYTWFAPSSPGTYTASLSPVSLASPSVSPFEQAMHAQAALAAQHRLSATTTTTTSLQPLSLSPLSMPTLFSPAPPPATAAGPPKRDLLLRHILPSAQFFKFVAYVLQTTMVGQAAVLLSILYLERYRRVCQASAKAAGGRHTGGNINRLFVTSLVLANKTLDDNTFTNATWASISGLPLADINSMERQFLAGIGFHLHVTPDEYRAWVARLWDLDHSRRETIRSFTALRAQQQQQHLSRPLSDGSQSSRPPSFSFGSSLPPPPQQQQQQQQQQAFPPLQTYAPPLFAAPEGFHLHPSYLPPLAHQHPYFAAAAAAAGPQQPPSQQLPPMLAPHASLLAGGAVPCASGQVTPRASFDGSVSLPTLNLNPAISTPASHRPLDVLSGLLKSASPSSRTTHAAPVAKRRAGEAFSPSHSPLAAAASYQQRDEADPRPTKRLQTALDPRPSSSSSRPPSMSLPWAVPPGVAPHPHHLGGGGGGGGAMSLPSLHPSSSPMQILGQPWVFEGHDAMGTKQLYVCSLMADGPRRYQLVQQQRPAAAPVQPTLAAPGGSSSGGFLPYPYLVPMHALSGYQRHPPPSASSSLVGQHPYSASPSSMMLPPPSSVPQPAYHSLHPLQQQQYQPHPPPAPQYLPPIAFHPSYHQPQQPQQQRAPPPPPFPGMHPYLPALAPLQPDQQQFAPAPAPSAAKASPARAAPPPVVEHVDPEAAKRNRVERWRRDVSASSGGDY